MKNILKNICLCSLLVSLSGCYSIGNYKLGKDQDEYSKTLMDANKRQTLLNIVRLRYADTLGFLDTTQLISGYQLQRSAFLGVASDTFPIRPNGGIAAQLQESPTFTFQPISGDSYAQSFLHPLSPANLLPLAMGGLPIDVLMQISVQSINMMSNNRVFSKNAGDIDDNVDIHSEDFFEVIHNLRLLQAAGLLGIQLQQVPEVSGKSPAVNRVFLSILSTSDPRLSAVVAKTRRALNFTKTDKTMEVVYGVGKPRPGEIRLLTRSMLSVFGQFAYQIHVPNMEVASGSTIRYAGPPGHEDDNNLMKVYVGQQKPDDCFVSIFYDNYYYWIAKGDFPSKVSFTITQMLFELSRTTKSPSAIVTIPVN